jgi:steroid delta-isomerase-like uncharacterized protein
MSAEDNKALVRRYQEAHNSNNLAALNDIVAPDLISHNKIPGMPAGLEGGKVVHGILTSAFPDLHTDTEDLVAEGDKVVQRFTVSGTDKGGFMGAPATNKSYKVPGISVFRIANGKIAEHWGVFDQMSIMQQLGKLPG